MSSKPLLYLTSGDIDSELFESQIISFCHFLRQEFKLPLRIVHLSVGGQEEYPMGSELVEYVQLSDDWWHNSEARLTLERHLDLEAVGSLMTHDPRIAAFLLPHRSDDRPFFYHALTCNYLALEAAQSASLAEVQVMRALELDAIKKADWIYASTEALVTHFKDQAAYRDHNHSILPLAPLQAKAEHSATLGVEVTTPQTVTFMYAGAIDLDQAPRALLEAFAEVLRHEHYRLLICSQDIAVLQAFPFLQHERCTMHQVDLRAATAHMHLADYGLIIERSGISSTYMGSLALVCYLTAGCRVVISANLSLLSQTLQSHKAGLSYAGRKENTKLAELEALTNVERTAIQGLAKDIFDRSASINQVKFRNLERLHHGY